MRQFHRILIIFLILGIVFTWMPNFASFGSRYLKYHILLGLLITYNIRSDIYKFGWLEVVVIIGLSGEIILSLFRISFDFLRLTELLFIFINMTIFLKGRNEFKMFIAAYKHLAIWISILSLLSLPLVIYGFVYDIPTFFGYEYIKEISPQYSSYISADYLQVTPLGVIFNSDPRILSAVGFPYTLCGYSYEPHVAMFLVCPGLLLCIGSSRGLKRVLLITLLVLFALATSSVTGILALSAVFVLANIRRIYYLLTALGLSLLGLNIFTNLFEALQQFIIFKFSDDSTSRLATYGMANYLFSANSFLGNGFFKLPEASSTSAGVFGSLFFLVFVSLWFRKLITLGLRQSHPYYLPLLYTSFHMLKLPIQVFNYPLFFFSIILLSHGTKIVRF